VAPSKLQAQKRGLDIEASPAQKGPKVLPFPNNLYARWRLQSGAAPLLREPGESPPERLLQAVWQHQRLKRDRLKSLDGEPVRILHPGFANREGGPDFRDAVIQFGSAPPRSGDVEVDIHAAGWHAHGHDRNPAFERVILHVIWSGARSGTRARPPGVRPPAAGSTGTGSAPRPTPVTVAIGDQLDAPAGDLGVWLSPAPGDLLPERLRGRCSGVLQELSPDQRSRLMREAAQIRFEGKARQLQARAREAGWAQALWEGIFRALGYKHNVWPMHCLAEGRDRWLAAPASLLQLQSRLLGIANLLPADLTRSRPSADGYLRRVWDHWWREREEYQGCILPATLWRLHGQRPANSPQRRLALVAHWLVSGDLVARIERWCAATIPDAALAGSLMKVLQPKREDDFWCWHWTLRSNRLQRPQPLLGLGRVTDLAVNVILPWLWIRAGEGRNTGLQRGVEHRFQQWPPAADNAVLRLARQRLLGGVPAGGRRSAAGQQGLIQIIRDFCDHSNAVCEGCSFPELARASTAG
jgi:hypothetical protein